MISSTPSPSAACLWKREGAGAARNNCLFAGIYLKSVKGRERKRLNARIREGDGERETTRPLHRSLFVGCLVGLGVTVEYDACCHKGSDPSHWTRTFQLHRGSYWKFKLTGLFSQWIISKLKRKKTYCRAGLARQAAITYSLSLNKSSCYQ